MNGIQELKVSMKELVTCKVHEEPTSMEAIIDLEVYHKTAQGLSDRLKLSEADGEQYMEECRKAKYYQISVVEPENRAITGQLLEYRDTQEQLLYVADELKLVKEELLHMKIELNAMEESKVSALKLVELMEASVTVEKEKNKELLVQLSELNEVILSFNLSATEEEKKWFAFISELDVELQIATSAVIRSHQQLKEMSQQLNAYMDLESVLVNKTQLIESLRLELNQVKELNSSSVKADPDAINGLSQLKSEMELIERTNTENRSHSMSMEVEVKQKEEVQNAREKIDDLNGQIVTITSEMENLKEETSKNMDRELQLQVEIAGLRSELHKGRSRIAAAEAAKIRATRSQAGLYLAMQQLAVEAEAARNEVRMLKLKVNDTETEQKMEYYEFRGKGSEMDFVTASIGFCSAITISTEYDSFIQKSEKSEIISDILPYDESQMLESGSRLEVDILKEELQAANAEISSLRFCVEEAVRRAETAEKAKEEIEDQLKKWRQKQQQIRGASETHCQKSTLEHTNIVANGKHLAYHSLTSDTRLQRLSGCERTPAHKEKNSNYVTLAKLFNMKF